MSVCSHVTAAVPPHDELCSQTAVETTRRIKIDLFAINYSDYHYICLTIEEKKSVMEKSFSDQHLAFNIVHLIVSSDE